MNEKIKELALQAGGSHYPTVGGKTLETFAELIVKECANVAADHDALDIYEEIREHFGVEK